MAGSSALRLATRPASTVAGGDFGRGGPLAAPPPSRPDPSAAGARGRGWLARALGRSAEFVLALGVTLGFFAAFLFILSMVFPMGLSLETLATQLQSDRSAQWRARAGTAGGTATTPAAATAALASLTVLRADVRSKPADAIEWNPARDGQKLQDRDGVQTGAQGRARLKFGAGGELTLERSSLVILSGAAGRAGESGGSAVIVVEGEIWARFTAEGASSPRLALGSATVRAGTDGAQAGPSEFRVRMQKDRAGTISVLSGSLQLESGSGRVRVGPREFATVAPSGTVAPPRPLAPEPRVLAPAEGETFPYQDVPPQIAFRWSESAGADGYRLVVAQDRDGRETVVDEIVTAPSLTWGRLKEGRYVWRVTARVDGVEGVPSAWRRLTVARAAGAPTLTVEPLPTLVEGRALRLAGRIDGHATVYVSGVRVPSRADGSFEYELELKPGANVIVVEAVDAIGNTAYWSQIVNARY